MVSGRNERRRFKLADTAQQIVGGVLFAGSFVVTEEVWALARNMSSVQSALIVGIVAAVGYASLYKADPNRDPQPRPRSQARHRGNPAPIPLADGGYPSARWRCSR
jgi:uncharacterized membrane protein